MDGMIKDVEVYLHRWMMAGKTGGTVITNGLKLITPVNGWMDGFKELWEVYLYELMDG